MTFWNPDLPVEPQETDLYVVVDEIDDTGPGPDMLVTFVVDRWPKFIDNRLSFNWSFDTITIVCPIKEAEDFCSKLGMKRPLRQSTYWIRPGDDPEDTTEWVQGVEVTHHLIPHWPEVREAADQFQQSFNHSAN